VDYIVTHCVAQELERFTDQTAVQTHVRVHFVQILHVFVADILDTAGLVTEELTGECLDFFFYHFFDCLILLRTAQVRRCDLRNFLKK